MVDSFINNEYYIPTSEVDIMDNRGQTTFEYLLLVGGVVILAVLVIWMLTSGVQGSAQDVNATIGQATNKLTGEANDVISKINVP